MTGSDWDTIQAGEDGVILELYRPGRGQGRIFLDHIVPLAGGAGPPADVMEVYRMRDDTLAGIDIETIQCIGGPNANDIVSARFGQTHLPTVDSQLGRRANPSAGVRFEFDIPGGAPGATTDVIVPIGDTIAESMNNLYNAMLQRYVEQNLPMNVSFDGVDTITAESLVAGSLGLFLESTGTVRFTRASIQPGQAPGTSASDLVATIPLVSRHTIDVGLMMTEGCFLKCSADSAAQVFYRHHGQSARLSGYSHGEEAPLA